MGVASPFNMPSQSEVVIDCRGHLLGRLASTVAKEMLSGQKIVLVRCEELNISGELFRNKLKWESFRSKRTNTNPKKGPFHYRSPADLIRRSIRGMVPHKTARGAAAMERLTCFVGVPPPFDKKKRVVIPQALRVTHLRPNRTTQSSRISATLPAGSTARLSPSSKRSAPSALRSSTKPRRPRPSCVLRLSRPLPPRW